MRRLTQPEAIVQLEWLADQPEDERMTGYSPAGWKAETWVLHSMYENPDLHGLGTHDDVRRRALEGGEATPDIVGGINLDDVTTSTGTPLGFSTKPGPPWQRLTWSSYLSRFPEFGPNRTYPPCFQWFPAGSWPAAIEPPPEGSLDEDALHALIEVLADAPSLSPEPWCFAFYAALPARDFDDRTSGRPGSTRFLLCSACTAAATSSLQRIFGPRIGRGSSGRTTTFRRRGSAAVENSLSRSNSTRRSSRQPGPSGTLTLGFNRYRDSECG